MQSVVCARCGIRTRADRKKCPRCRAPLVEPNPAPSASRSRLFARCAAGITGASLLGLSITYVRVLRSSAVEHKPIELARAAAGQPFSASYVASESAGGNHSGERPFVDPSGAGALAYRNGGHASALEHFQAAVARNPQDAESQSNLGQVLVRLGRVTEAIPYFERAITIIPGRWAYRFNLARALGLLGRWDEAIGSYRKAQELFPDDYATTFNLARALHKKGDEPRAVDEYRKAIALNPDDASFHMALAISLERIQRFEEAAAAYTEYLRLSPAASDAAGVRARIAQLSGPPRSASTRGAGL
jgi:Flp pilus assembly protein TadD